MSWEDNTTRKPWSGTKIAAVVVAGCLGVPALTCLGFGLIGAVFGHKNEPEAHPGNADRVAIADDAVDRNYKTAKGMAILFMQYTLKDADSAKFRFPDRLLRGSYHAAGLVYVDAWEFRMEVNARNGFGGYNGFQQWIMYYTEAGLVAVQEPDKEYAIVLDAPIAAAAIK